jgi:outer membrane protein assembly factor BamA
MRLLKVVFLFLLLLLLNPDSLLAAADDNVSTDNSGVHWIGLPVFYSTPETDVALGGTLMGFHKSNPNDPQGKTDVFQGVLIGTQKEQKIFSLNLKKYFLDDRYLMIVGAGYIDFPSEFFGIGPVAEENLEEDYTLIQNAVIGSFLWRLAPNFYLGPLFRYSRFGIEDRAQGEQLAQGNIDGWDGATVAGGGLSLVWDTRDDEFMPRNGSELNIQAMDYRRDWGSDDNFSQLAITHKIFQPVLENNTLAWMSFLSLSQGTVPFEMMPALGGDTIMRGYYSGRYRDRDYAALQGEYRYKISTRFSGVLFAGVGEVATEIDEFTADHVKAAAGFGFRFLLVPEQKIKLRLDIGMSESGTYSYVNFMEAF